VKIVIIIQIVVKKGDVGINMGAYKEIQIIMDETGKSEKEATEFFIERKNKEVI